MSLDGLVLDLASRLHLKDLQHLAHTSREWRRAVQTLPAHAWQRSAALTLPVWHPLAAAQADVPAAASSLCSANAALRQGAVSSLALELPDAADVLLLQPDFTRALVIRNGCMENVDTQQLLEERPAKRARTGKQAVQLPGTWTWTHFMHLYRAASSPCGRYCLLCVHHEPSASWPASAVSWLLQWTLPGVSRRLLPQPRVELVIWDIAAGAVAGMLCSAASNDCNSLVHHKIWKWLPDSSLYLSDSAGGRVCVFSPQAQLLGSADVGVCQHYQPQEDDVAWRFERFVPSPAGTFLAGQSGSCLTILSVPACTTYLELELEPEFSRILGELSVEPHVRSQVHWSPDGELVLYSAYDIQRSLLCSVRDRCWSQALGPIMEKAGADVSAWLPCGALGWFTTEEPFPGICKVELAFADPLGPADIAQPLSPSLPGFTDVLWAPDFSWLAAITGEARDTVVILASRSLQVVAQCQSDRGGGAALLWAASGNALLCFDQCARPLQLLRFP